MLWWCQPAEQPCGPASGEGAINKKKRKNDRGGSRESQAQENGMGFRKNDSDGGETLSKWE